MIIKIIMFQNDISYFPDFNISVLLSYYSNLFMKSKNHLQFPIWLPARSYIFYLRTSWRYYFLSNPATIISDSFYFPSGFNILLSASDFNKLSAVTLKQNTDHVFFLSRSKPAVAPHGLQNEVQISAAQSRCSHLNPNYSFIFLFHYLPLLKLAYVQFPKYSPDFPASMPLLTLSLRRVMPLLCISKNLSKVILTKASSNSMNPCSFSLSLIQK